MQIVVVSSPGCGTEPHWSHAFAADLAALAIARGASVRWLAALHADQSDPEAPDGVELSLHKNHRTLPDTKVADSQHDAELDVALTEYLRDRPLAVVVHLGLGGRGSPNVLWLSDRMGSRTFAYLHGDELVCQRGNLIDRDGKACTEWQDPDRCRWCCSTSWFGRPIANDLRNRVDLFLAGLQTCAGIAVPHEDQIAKVVDIGMPKNRVAVAATAEEFLDVVLSAIGCRPL